MVSAALRGVRVLDMSQYLPGPFATRMLADFGADVVKVEPPAGDPMRFLSPEGHPGEAPFYKQVNAGKTVITVDLKTDEGKAHFDRLIRMADVLLESYRPGVMDRLGFGWQHLREINPRLVHCALSGFGQTGPLRDAPGHDIGYVAMTGTLSACGTAEAPVIPFPPLADHAGATQAVIAIFGALMARHTSGEGAFLDVSLMESLLLWQAPGITIPAGRAEGVINGGAAFYQIYRTADGEFVTLSPIEAKFWENFCAAVERPDWVKRRFDPLPQTALIEELAALFASQPLAHWEAVLVPADCCYQAVLHGRDVPEDPHIAERGFVHRGDDYVEVRLPVRVDGAPPPARPKVRESNAETIIDAWAAQI
jgi:crotonobetainyl-CoA:carnitine CoA-transferase CaiB-like acyl-CoA transferase